MGTSPPAQMGGCCDREFAHGVDRIATQKELKEIYAELDTGDILLFQSNGGTGCFTRCCTNSTWDHVAIIIKRTKEDGPREGPIPVQKEPAKHKCCPDYCTCIA